MTDLAKRYPEEFKEFKKMAAFLNKRPDLVQGKNASISIKLDDDLMLVSAAGVNIKDVTDKRNLVVLEYNDLAEWFRSTTPQEIREGVENQGQARLTEALAEDQLISKPVPSELAASHALLSKYVVHCNSVCANIVNSSYQGIGITTKLLLEADYDWLWIPYNRQPSKIAFMLAAAIDQHIERRESEPQVFFLQNNGLLVHGDSWEEVLEILDDIDQKFSERLKLDVRDYPVSTVKGEKKLYLSQTEYLKSQVFGESFEPDKFMDLILASQRINDCWQKISFTGKHFDEKIQALDNLDNFNLEQTDIVLNSDDQTISYKMSEKDALQADQLLTTVCYILDKQAGAKLTVQPISKTAPDFVGR